GATLVLQAAEQEWLPEFVRKALNFFIEHELDFAPGRLPRWVRWLHGLGPSFVLAPPLSSPPRVGSDPLGDPMQPAGQRTLLLDPQTAPGEQDERSLKSVLGILVLAQDAPAGGQNQRPMAMHQGGEGRLVVGGVKGAQ